MGTARRSREVFILVEMLLMVVMSLMAFDATCHAAPGAAAELESRLFAPCCYTQTLDVHESELASKLRAEVRARLAAGERSQHIEDDLAARFGERIRAVPRGRDPRLVIPALIALAMSASFAALLWLGMGWRKRSTARGVTSDALADREHYEAALDAELAHSLHGDD